MYLYLIRNGVNGKGYVGITTNYMSIRWLQHLQDAQRPQKQTLLARALRKYGADVFTMTLLGQAENWTMLQAMERAAIQEYGTFRPQGYNMTLGGDGAFGLIQTPEHRQKIGEAQRGEKNHRYGKHVTEAHKERLRQAHIGNKYSLGMKASPDTRRKLSALRLGKPRSAETRARIAAGKRGKPRDEATKRKLSLKAREQFARQGNPMQGRTHSAETRAKIAAKALGRQAWNAGRKSGPLSEETRAKLSQAHKGRAAWNKGVKATAETKAKLSASRIGGKNWKARAIVLDGITYPSIMDAVRATGLSQMQVKYRLKTGRAQYLDMRQEE